MDRSLLREAVEERYCRLVEAGEVLFRQGEHGDAAYVIDAGAIEIYAEGDDGRQTIARLTENELFGEMALLGDSRRSASAMALEPSRLLVITPEHLRERLEAADPLTRHLLRTLVLRSRELLQRSRPGPSPTGTADLIAAELAANDRRLAFGRVRIEQAMEQALRRREFQLYFQPVLRLPSGPIAGYEALIRWIKPDGSRVPPAEFIPVAESSDLIWPIGRWVLETAVDGLLRLARSGVGAESAAPLFMNVNLSARQLHDPQLLPLLAAQAARLRGQRCRLKLEVTESLMIGNVALMQAFIIQCRELGVPVVLDDFGTGYCSLSYLHLFEVQAMKLDRSFVRGISVSQASEKVVRGIVGMAHELGLEVVVEGVETADQAQQASGLGIDFAQGYYFARPAPLDELLPAQAP
ncbi:MAG: EAL domain-containing protein [Nevskiaceae bacterium]|nr:MAG: EAL domain-containing protein [Nevskiaceae bacterium]TAM24087.1 MAG: EAL domain-containing protein [Nevskiaceae bacterium]